MAEHNEPVIRPVTQSSADSRSDTRSESDIKASDAKAFEARSADTKASDSKGSKSKASGKKLVVLHDLVGTHAKGSIADPSDFDDHERLVEMGALGWVDEMGEELHQNLYQAARTQSPPTLPNAPYVDATEREKLLAAGALPIEHMRDEEFPKR